jgi:outer membrane protein TolC
MKQFVSLIGFALWSGFGTAQANCLPLQSMIENAVTTSPLVQGAKQNAERAQSLLDISRSQWSPKVSAFGRSAVGDSRFGEAQIDNSGGLRASQRLFDFGASSRQRAAAEFGELEAVYLIDAARDDEALKISLAYIDALEAQATIDALRKRLVYIIEKEEAVTVLLSQGAATTLEMSEALAEKARAEADLTEVQFDLADARARLQTWIGSIPNLCSLNAVQDSLAGLLPNDADARDLVALAVRRDPRLAARRARVAKLKIDAKLAKRSRLPVVELVGTSSYGYDQFNKDWALRNQVGVEINVPLLTGGQLNAETRIAMSEAKIADFEAIELTRDLQKSIRVASARLDNYKVEIIAREKAVAALSGQLESATLEYRVGGRSFSELFEVRLKFDAAAVRLIRLRHDRTRQLAAIVNWTQGFARD